MCAPRSGCKRHGANARRMKSKAQLYATQLFSRSRCVPPAVPATGSLFPSRALRALTSVAQHDTASSSPEAGKMASLLSVAIAAALAVGSEAQRVSTGNMPDLGYPEPYWYPIVQGNAADAVIVPKPAIQEFGDILPYTAGSSVCKWFAPLPGSPPSERGTCKTDISWITASAGFKKSAFDDTMINYILRFQLYGACYRSTQV